MHTRRVPPNPPPPAPPTPLSDTPPSDLDDLDLRILTALQSEGRSTWARLAERVGLSAPAVTERVRKLEDRGLITGYRADISADALGLPTLGFVAVSLRDPGEHEALLEEAAGIAEIQECHVVAGDYDVLLKVRCASPEALAELLRHRVRNLPGVGATRTTVVLQTVKETGALPLPAREQVDGAVRRRP